jgi:hypothetical protein
MSALGFCVPAEDGGGGTCRTASTTVTKAASSMMRCGLGSAVRYSTASTEAEASGSRRRSSRSRAEKRTHDAAVKEDQPSGNEDSANRLRPEAGCWTSAAARAIQSTYVAGTTCKERPNVEIHMAH